LSIHIFITQLYCTVKFVQKIVYSNELAMSKKVELSFKTGVFGIIRLNWMTKQNNALRR